MNLNFPKFIIFASLLLSATAQAAKLFCSARLKNAPTQNAPLTNFYQTAPNIQRVHPMSGEVLARGSGNAGSEVNGYYTRLIFNHEPTTLNQGSWVDLNGYVNAKYISAKVRVQAIQSSSYRVTIQGNPVRHGRDVSGEFLAGDDISTLIFNDGLGSKLELNCEVLNR